MKHVIRSLILAIFVSSLSVASAFAESVQLFGYIAGIEYLSTGKQTFDPTVVTAEKDCELILAQAAERSGVQLRKHKWKWADQSQPGLKTEYLKAVLAATSTGTKIMIVSPISLEKFKTFYKDDTIKYEALQEVRMPDFPMEIVDGLEYLAEQDIYGSLNMTSITKAQFMRAASSSKVVTWESIGGFKQNMNSREAAKLNIRSDFSREALLAFIGNKKLGANVVDLAEEVDKHAEGMGMFGMMVSASARFDVNDGLSLIPRNDEYAKEAANVVKTKGFKIHSPLYVIFSQKRIPEIDKLIEVWSKR